jgi:hypothetical protein
MSWTPAIESGTEYLVPGRRKMRAIEPVPRQPGVWWFIDKDQRWHAFGKDKIKPISKKGGRR